MKKKSHVIETTATHQWAAFRSLDRGYLPMLHPLRQANDEASFAMQLLTKSVLAAFDENGEDSAGRQKGRRLSPDELVEYCFGVSAATFKKMESAGMFISVPTLEVAKEHYVDSN